MEIESRLDGGVVVAALKGRLDAVTAPEFDSWFSGQVQAGKNRLVLDMSGLDYISSAGLRSLLAAAKKVKETSGGIALCGVTGTVEEVFRISGFNSIFTIVPTLQEAMSAVE